MAFEFTLKFSLPLVEPDLEELVERLGESGCDDALVGIGQAGRIGLQFTRHAQSAVAAIVSAIEDVKRAIPSARLIEVGPDFVGLTDIADIVGVSRQNMRKLMLAHTRTFPTPIHEGSASLWHLAHVLEWLVERGTYAIDANVREVAHTAMQVNQTREATQVPHRVQKDYRELIS